MRVLFYWTDISGYMAACWRELTSILDGEVHVVANASSYQTAFASQVMEGVAWTPVPAGQKTNASYMAQQMRIHKPNVVVVSGWSTQAYRSLVHHRAGLAPKYLMAMDTPWRGTAKQYCARYVLSGYLKHIDAVFVTGERSWQYAQRLGFQERQLYRGLYGVDYEALFPMYDARVKAGPWPRRFLFVGRYSTEKGIEMLVNGYAGYRDRVADPWPLVCCGCGPLAPLLRKQPGVTDLGFLQPDAVREEMRKSGALLLPSTFDPWPLALVEGAAAGMPVVCSEACGSSVEIIRDGYSGFTFATGDRLRFVDRLCTVHHSTILPSIGSHAQSFAAAYSSHEWARRWKAALEETVECRF
jgi:glycosyltransferase involved in cell wall biosynthesis